MATGELLTTNFPAAGSYVEGARGVGRRRHRIGGKARAGGSGNDRTGGIDGTPRGDAPVNEVAVDIHCATRQQGRATVLGRAVAAVDGRIRTSGRVVADG